MQNNQILINDKTWAIAFVNYYSSDLMDFQLRQLSAIKKTHNFNIYIVDNSRNSEIEKLKNLISKYGFTPVTFLFYNGRTEKVSSAAHAEGLEIILKNTSNEDYLLVQDPDYFWLEKDHLLMLNKAINYKNLIAIGSSYKKKVINGNADFPCAFGAAYKFSEIDKDAFSIPERLSLIHENATDSLSFNKEKNLIDDYEFFDTFEYDYSFDVGWKIRKTSSDCNYESFKQFPALGFRNIFGVHSFESRPQLYFYNNEPISIHLFRGSFTGLPENLNKNYSKLTPPEWNKVRIKYAKFAFFISRFTLVKKVAIKLTYFFHHVKDHNDFNLSYLFVQNIYIPEKRLKDQLNNYKKVFLKEEIETFNKYSLRVGKGKKKSFIIFNKFLNPIQNKNTLKSIKEICIKIFGQTNNQYTNALYKTLLNLNIKSYSDFIFLLRAPHIKIDEGFDSHFFDLKMRIQILLILENLTQ